jgi:hypothetical protein
VQVERVVVEQRLRLGVGAEEHLEAAIEQEAVHRVGAHTPAHAVAGLDDEHGHPGGVQPPGAGQAGQAGADDDRRHRRCTAPRPASTPTTCPVTTR